MKNEFRVTIVGVEKGDTIDRRASGTRIKTIKSRFIPRRSTAGFIRYLASTIVQLNFHSDRRIRILEIFHYRIKIPCKILIFDGNEIQKLQTPRNLKIHLSFKVNFLRNRKFYHIFSI